MDKAQLLGFLTPTVKKHHVKTWNADVYLRSLTIKELFAYERLNRTEPEQASLYMLGCALCDEAGKNLFSAEEVEQFSAAGLIELSHVVSEMNNPAADDIEAVEKN